MLSRWRAGIAVLCIVAACAPALAIEVSGEARVVDGDTIDIGPTRIRLHGIDAPEGAQRCVDGKRRPWGCGSTATHRLDRLVDGSAVRCVGDERDAYGRLIGTCFAHGKDLNAEMVREGLAWAFVKYSADYVAVEAEARAGKRGVFAADNQAPWEFRAAKWGEATANAERVCPIKGNVNRSGERIYHMPWQRDYARVKIDEVAGKRWFCDESEAERAGWRRAFR